jgi:hypothetical protein
MKKLFTMLCLVLSLIIITAFAQTDTIKESRIYVQKAMTAYKDKKYDSFLENMKKANSLRPLHPTLMYNLASAYALNGNSKEALNWLGKVADMSLIYPAASDSDFESIKKSDEFQDIVKRFEANRSPVNHSSTAFTLPEKGLIAEGIAFDPDGETFYISSVRKRKIMSVSKSGEVKDFSAPQDGLYGVFGMKLDSKRRILWACSSAIEQMEDFKKEDKGSVGIFKYDLKSNKLLKKYLLPKKDQNHVFGDLALNSDGDVFITDSFSPVIYTISHNKDELEVYFDSEPFASLQGIDFSEDERYLFVSDYLRGIFVIDTKSKSCLKLAHPENVAMLSVDGLYFYKGSLVAIQNDINPNRVVRFYLNKEFNRIDRAEVIEANNPLFNEPTLGVLVKDTLYYIANGHWGSVDRGGNPAPAEKLQNHLILKVKL